MSNNIASYTLEDISKHSCPTKAGTREFIVLKENCSDACTGEYTCVEVLNNTRYLSEDSALDAALEDAYKSAEPYCSVVKSSKVTGTGVRIAVVILGEKACILCKYRVVELP